MPERVGAAGRQAFAPAATAAKLRRVSTTEDAAVVQFETDAGALGSVVVSQVSAGRKNRLWIELDGAEEALAFDQEQPGAALGAGVATAADDRPPRSRRPCRPAAARFATLPGGHPQGYADCFDAFVADFYEASRGGSAPDGMPTFADGLRAAQITDAVLASAREERWVDVGRRAARSAVAT